MLGRVQGEVADPENRRSRAWCSTDQRAHPGEQLLERERFREIVVRALIEPMHPIRYIVASGEHQDRRPAIGPTQLTTHLETVDVRQHDVENDGIKGDLGPKPDPIGACGCDIDRVALLAQAAAEEHGHFRRVLDHQQSHGRSPPLVGRS